MSLCAATKELASLRKEVLNLRNKIEDIKRGKQAYGACKNSGICIPSRESSHLDCIYKITHPKAPERATPEES